ncbi:MAG: 6-phosphogluconolactonase, partial [Planctomycetia bacterium]|nr:6-phosphogluconolactonase [Planctomycetia bacterium]
MNIIYDRNICALQRAAAELITDSIVGLLAEKELVVLAVPGGRSVSGIFALFRAQDIPWRKVHIFMVDERLVPLSDDRSNFKLAREGFTDALVAEGKLPQENVHPFVFDGSKEDSGLAGYEEELRDLGGACDIVLLSSGEDGHIGALYPNHHSFRDESEFYVAMHDSPKPPPDRMTMSRKLLLRA